MTLATLEKATIPQLTGAFNAAFAGYFAPLQLTEEQVARKIELGEINRELSAGAWSGEQLVGFIWHGQHDDNGRRRAYNTGTGVVPAFRGQGLTRQMYQHLEPILQENGFVECWLEVIEENAPARRAYRATGFEEIRHLRCFHGTIQPAPRIAEVRPLPRPDWPVLTNLWSWTPSWQNAAHTIENAWEDLAAVGLYEYDTLLAYAVFNPATGRVPQFAVHPEQRRRGLGRQLFGYIQEQTSQELAVINVDGSAAGTLRFLETLGMENHINQYEMCWDLAVNQ
ncbi:MAG: GNAT family N-acetyltransferase [Lewinella sp.]|nr:GNAT family N-acetyltransferase [Lewinella sp.]